VQLEKLDQFSIIEYLPQKEIPQIFFLLNRAPAAYLHIDQDLYFKRKKQYQFRIDAMISYIQTSDACRSSFISNYFGEKKVSRCGKCDNCLNSKKTSLSSSQFQAILKKIQLQVFKVITVKELLLQFQTIESDDIWMVLKFMESEQMILISEDGTIKKLI
jgi:ATP-dependent DNA helicase RecQ